jgi:hypothetical protein
MSRIAVVTVILAFAHAAVAQSVVETFPLLETNPMEFGDDAGLKSVAVHGNTLYLAGPFTTVGGQSRRGLAAVDVTTHTVLPWDPCGTTDCFVDALRVSQDGTTVFVGGTFTDFGGSVRTNVAAIEAESGTLTSWQASQDPGAIERIALSQTTLFTFGKIGSVTPTVSAFNVITGVALPQFCAPDVGGTVRGLEVSTDGLELYVGGNSVSLSVDFHRRICGTIDEPAGCDGNGVSRSQFVALDAVTGCVTSFNPGKTTDPVLFILADGPAVYLAGAADFYRNGDGSQLNSRIAKYTASALDAEFDTSNVVFNGGIRGAARVGETLYIVGEFNTVANQARNRLAAVNANTGALLDWNLSNDMGGQLDLRIAGTATKNEVYVVDSQMTLPHHNIVAVTGVNLCANVTCQASDQCHNPGTCEAATGACSAGTAKDNGASCTDSNACTTGDACQSGVCIAGTTVVCMALDICHMAGECNTQTGLCSNPEIADCPPDAGAPDAAMADAGGGVGDAGGGVADAGGGVADAGGGGAVAGGGCADAGGGVAAAGGGGADAGGGAADAGGGVADAGGGVADAGGGVADAGGGIGDAAGMDGGTPPVDAGSVDSGVADGGNHAHDSGQPARDAGTQADASAVGGDGGTALPADASVEPPIEEGPECTCASIETRANGIGTFFGVFAAVFALRRRRPGT